MSTKKIIIDIPFNISFKDHFPEKYKQIQVIFDNSFQKSQTREWIDYRINIFMKYTGKSLINQNNQNFLCILRCNESSKELIHEVLSNYPKLPENIIFVSDKEADEIVENAVNQHDYLYHVRIDSDNMYESHFIDIVDNYVYEDGTECLLCHEGYMYDEPSNRLARLNHPSPSFYVDIYNKETYKLNFRKRLFEDHMEVKDRQHVSLPGYNYMIIVHGCNLSNQFDEIIRWLNGNVVNEKEKQEILKYWDII